MKLLHRDVSVENMMYRLGTEGNVVGVLNDFDLAIMLSEQANGPVSKQRTGTRPYMAIELLESVDGNPPLHLCRHDLESMMYAIVDLVCFRHASAEDKNDSPIAEWFLVELTTRHLANSKLAFLNQARPQQPSEHMKNLSGLVLNLRRMFRHGYNDKGNAVDYDNLDEFDHETLGGHITLNKFAGHFGL